MPRYKVTDNESGKSYLVESDSPLSEDEIQQHLDSQRPSAFAKAVEYGKTGLPMLWQGTKNLLRVPGEALSQGATTVANLPTDLSNFARSVKLQGLGEALKSSPEQLASIPGATPRAFGKGAVGVEPFKLPTIDTEVVPAHDEPVYGPEGYTGFSPLTGFVMPSGTRHVPEHTEEPTELGGAYNAVAKFLNQMLSRENIPLTAATANPIGFGAQLPSMVAETPEALIESSRKLTSSTPGEKGEAAMDILGRLLLMKGGRVLYDERFPTQGPKYNPQGTKPEIITPGSPEMPFTGPLGQAQRFEVGPQGRAIDLSQGRFEREGGVREARAEPQIIGQPQPTGQRLFKPLPPLEIINPPQESRKAPVEETRGRISYGAQAEAGAIPSARQAEAGSVKNVPEQERLMQGQFVPSTEQGRVQSGIDPDVIKRIVPAVRVAGRMLVGKQGDSHDDLLKANQIDSKLYPHEDPSRGFVDTSTGKFLTRQEAEQASGLKGTARAGGLDSQDLPGGRIHPIQRYLSAFKEKGLKTLYSEPGMSEEEPTPYVVFDKPTPEQLSKIQSAAKKVGAEVEVRENRTGVYMQDGPPKEVLQDWHDFSEGVVGRLSSGIDPSEALKRAKEEVDKIFETGKYPPDWESRKTGKHVDTSTLFTDSKKYDDLVRGIRERQEVKGVQDQMLLLETKYGGRDPREVYKELNQVKEDASLFASRKFDWDKLQSGIDPTEPIKALSARLAYDPRKIRPYMKGTTETRDVRMVGSKNLSDIELVNSLGVKVENRKFPGGASKLAQLGDNYLANLYRNSKQVVQRFLTQNHPDTAGKAADAEVFTKVKPVWDELEKRILSEAEKRGITGKLEKEAETVGTAIRMYSGVDPSVLGKGKEAVEKLGKLILTNPNAKPLNLSKEAKQPGESTTGLSAVKKALSPSINLAKEGDRFVNPKDVIFDWLGGGKGEYTSRSNPLMAISEAIDDQFNEALKLEKKESAAVKQLIRKNNVGSQEAERIGVYLKRFEEGGIQSMLDAGVKQETIDNITKTLTPTEREIASAMKRFRDRTKDSGVVWPQDLNATAAFGRYVKDWAHTTSLKSVLNDARAIIDDPKFKKTYGDLGQELIKEHLDVIVRQGQYRHNAFLDTLRKLSTRGVIALRIPSQLVHLANVPLAWGRAGPLWWKKGLSEAFGTEGRKFLQEHFAETYARGGGEPSLQEISDLQAKTKLGKAYNAVSKAGFFIQRQLDQLNAQATVLGIYMRKLKEKGLDPDKYAALPVDKQAIREARTLARRAVASPLYKDIPLALSRGGSLSRTLFQFQNTFLDQWSNIRYDLLNQGVSQAIAGNPKLAMRMTLAIGGMFLVEASIKHGYKQALSAATGSEMKKDDTFWRTIEHEALRRIPGMGQLSSAIIYGETGVPSIDVALQPAREGYKFSKATDDAGRIISGTRAVGAIGETLGVPGTSQALDIATGIERGRLFPSYEKKVERATGRSPKEMDLIDRTLFEVRDREARKPLTREQSEAAAGRARKAEGLRGEELVKSLSKADQNWVNSRALVVPGFKATIRYLGQDVHLTSDEMDRYKTLVKAGVEMQLERLRPVYDSLEPSEQHKLFSESMSTAHRMAREVLLQEMKSSSGTEKDRPKRKRFSAFDFLK